MKNIKRKMKRLFYLRVAVLMTFFLGLCFAFSPLPVQAARLFGVTGDGANTPETLFVLDQDNASPTFFLELGAGDNGETIAFNPVDSLLYHLSGNSNKIFESIDPITLEITPIILSGDNYNEVRAATYDTLNDVFFLVDISRSFFSLTTDGTVGTVTKLPNKLDHKSKGLAFVGDTLYSVSRDDNLLRTINPATGETLSSVPITLPGFTITGANGLATHPGTDELWALLKDSDNDRHLVMIIDPDSDPVVATDKGSTGDKFASIAFDTISEFSTFTLKKAMVKFNHILNNDEFLVKGKFVLGEDSNGIDPFNEEVIVKVGNSSIVITPDSFEYGGPGIYKFKGTIDGARVKMKIVEIDTNTFVFMAKGKGFDLTGTSNPVGVELVIGNDIGQSSIRLKGELNSWWKGKKRKKHHGDDDSSGHKKWKKLKKWKKHRSDDDSSDDD